MWLAVQNRADELHLVPADEPREWSDDCWCLPEWDCYIERLAWADTSTTPWTASYAESVNCGFGGIR
jgi:hypothetical protein